MVRSITIVSALCFLALAANVYQAQGISFTVKGKVYCDPCRGQFRTRIAYNIPEATVKLVCTNIDNSKITFQTEATTDRNGEYNIHVDGDHSTDICEVKALKSPNESCNQIMNTQLDTARIEISDLAGMDQDHVRFANELPFVPSERDKKCKWVFSELGLAEDGSPLADGPSAL